MLVRVCAVHILKIFTVWHIMTGIYQNLHSLVNFLNSIHCILSYMNLGKHQKQLSRRTLLIWWGSQRTGEFHVTRGLVQELQWGFQRGFNVSKICVQIEYTCIISLPLLHFIDIFVRALLSSLATMCLHNNFSISFKCIIFQSVLFLAFNLKNLYICIYKQVIFKFRNDYD